MRKIWILLLSIFVLNANDLEIYIKKYSHEPRNALVIGNADYKVFKKLKNPIKDSADIRDLLKKLGFKVIYITNGNKKLMKKAIRRFYEKIKNGGVGLFYYAGQGVEVDFKNYLIPVEADIKEVEDVDSEAIHLSDVTQRMTKARNRANIIILDASRSNPFYRGGKDGLAGIRNTKGIYIAYATEPGKPAREGVGGRNGLFTKYLKKFISKRGLTIDQVFNKVRKSVHKASNGTQLPYTSSGMLGGFYFSLPRRKEIGNQFSIPMETVVTVSTHSKSKPTQKKYRLKISTIPSKANVEFMNIQSFYHDNIMLPRGKYEVKISKDGYLAKTGSFLLDKNTEFKAKLEKLSNFSTPAKPVKVASVNLGTNRGMGSKKVWMDSSTGLMWERKTKRNKNFDVIWTKAEKYCSTLKIDNFRDWRLPTKNELSTLLTKKKFQGKYIKENLSRNIGKWGWYWSSTHVNQDEIELIYFNEGISSVYHKSVKYYVRCVREVDF